MDFTTSFPQLLFDLNTTSRNAVSINSCEPFYRVDLAVFAGIIAIEIVWNFLILAAIYMSRKKLRQNYVYSYVTSMIAANIALGILMFYTLLEFLFAFEKSPAPVNPPTSYNPHKYNNSDIIHVRIMDWWGFRKTLMVGLFLIMNANVVCLIRGITKTAYIVGRGGVTSVTLQIRIRSSSVSSDPEKVTRKLLRGKGEAILIISLSWIIPLIYTLLIFGWNCRDYCTCLPAYYNKKHFCSTENEPLKCSNIWAPMRKGHLLLAVAIWAAQLIAIVLMLIFASRKYYRKAIKPTSPSKPPLEKDAENNDEITTLPRTQSTVSQKPYKPPLHPSMKLLIVLSTLYVLSTAPMMLCFLIDSVVTSRTYVSDLLVTISSAIVFVYCFVGPVFMIKYMPGLKSALVRMFLRCDCTVTTAVTNVARSVTMRARNRSNV